jgi:hypothetical protein
MLATTALPANALKENAKDAMAISFMIPMVCLNDVLAGGL